MHKNIFHRLVDEFKNIFLKGLIINKVSIFGQWSHYMCLNPFFSLKHFWRFDLCQHFLYVFIGLNSFFKIATFREQLKSFHIKETLQLTKKYENSSRARWATFDSPNDYQDSPKRPLFTSNLKMFLSAVGSTILAP